MPFFRKLDLREKTAVQDFLNDILMLGCNSFAASKAVGKAWEILIVL
jgi:hypothetical protein